MVEDRLADVLGSAYTIEGEIGRGGMGIVYRARDVRLRRMVAIKVLPPELAFRQDIRTRFLREAQTAARLSHPNIVPIHTVGEKDDIVYFVMGLVEGESLATRLKRRGRLSLEEARRVMTETADALSAAHQQAVIHRDVKPDNILLEGARGRVMVTDFGIAKALSAEGGTLTEAGVAIGTPAFMSPEQAAGDRAIDGRSDVYSLGVVGYLMIAGQPPFAASTVPALLMKQVTESPEPLDLKRPDTPRELSAIVMRCLEKNPDDRWPTADALRRALESGGYAAPPRPAPPISPVSARSEAAGAREWLEARRSEARGAIPSAPPSAPLPGRARRHALWRAERASRQEMKRERREQEEREIEERAKQAGEPLIVARFRHHLARSAAIGGGLMLINFAVAGGINHPWSLIVVAIFGFRLAREYATLWTSGYSWRDVIERPPAPDAIEARTQRGGARLPPGPAATSEFGRHAAAIEQARADRAAIATMLAAMPQAERQMLPDVGPTVDQLLARASELARTLHALERNLEEGSPGKIQARLASLEREPPSGDRERRMLLLEQQRQKVEQLISRRAALSSQLESCLLALQNVRFDMLRLRSAGVAEVLGDLTQATQQARSLSRDVDAAISAANEVKRLTAPDPSNS